MTMAVHGGSFCSADDDALMWSPSHLLLSLFKIKSKVPSHKIEHRELLIKGESILKTTNLKVDILRS